MNVSKTALPGVMVIEPQIFPDERGFFFEAFHQKKFIEAGLNLQIVQINQSHSIKNVLRGMHAQRSEPQGKFIRVLSGEIFDVAVDIRRSSPTFKKWVGVNLSSENKKAMYVPPGYVHGFCVLSESADVEYGCTMLYNPSDEMSVRWNDPDIAIEWPIKKPVLSEKDAAAPSLADILHKLPT